MGFRKSWKYHFVGLLATVSCTSAPDSFPKASGNCLVRIAGMPDKAKGKTILLAFDADGNTCYYRDGIGSSDWIELEEGEYTIMAINNPCQDIMDQLSSCATLEDAAKMQLELLSQELGFTSVLMSEGSGGRITIAKGLMSRITLAGKPLVAKITIRSICNAMTEESVPLDYSGGLRLESISMMNVSNCSTLDGELSNDLLNIPGEESSLCLSRLVHASYPDTEIAAGSREDINLSLYCFAGNTEGAVFLSIDTGQGRYNVPLPVLESGHEYILESITIKKKGGEGYGFSQSSEAGMEYVVGAWEDGGEISFIEDEDDIREPSYSLSVPHFRGEAGSCIFDSVYGKASVTSSNEDVICCYGSGREWMLYATGMGRATLTVSDGRNIATRQILILGKI